MSDPVGAALVGLVERCSQTPFFRAQISYFGARAHVKIWRTSIVDGQPRRDVVESYNTTRRAARWSARQALREVIERNGGTWRE